MSARQFNHTEKKLIVGISLVLGLRMLGVSMIIPIFSIYATELPGATSTLAGLALGIFGIVQIILQVPFGKLSDRWGRKKVTLAGLAIYFIGTILSGLSRNIYHLIGARVIAGAGAINGVTMAWLTDGIDVNRRSSALSYVGMSIGMAVILGFTMSPIIAAKVNIPFLFFLCAAMILVSILYTRVYMADSVWPDVEPLGIRKTTLPAVLGNRDLTRLNLIGLIGNFSLAGIFFIIPLVLKQRLGLEDMWKVFIPVALAGTGVMFYFGRKADTYGTVAIATLGLALELLGVILPVIWGSLGMYVLSFALFYSGHCILSPVLPAAASRYPDTQLKGTVMGVFNSFQFLGSGIGGVLCGFFLEFDTRYVFICLTVLTVAGIILLSRFKNFTAAGD